MIFELHRRLVEAVKPSQEQIRRYFELDSYTPHFTLGQTYWGMNEKEIEEMKSDARNALPPFPTFSVTHVRVYKEVEPDKYVPYEDIRLA
ncbi:2'-5' RNA ligase [Paenibacillus eucommiae]|uniref:2'-5' RNA ligase n=2 Tax=Paenibacillus eucommiae TaxID=1355755 RepID=A0ABS4JB05_9BACL|nr:2'-5' RNA ligase [Paenibacillus eucommiae]